MGRHYSLDELDRYAGAPDAFDGRAELEAHIDACGDCSAALAEARSFIADLAAPEVWRQTDALVTGEAARPLVELKQRIEREDAEAERLLRRPLASPLRFVWADVSHKRRFRSGGVVRLLCRLSKEAREVNTLHARNLAETAAAIADSLPDHYYPARGVNHLRGLAWKEVANALRYLGELRAAHDALDRAERAYRRLPVHELELASVQYVRGTILWIEQRLDAALDHARSSAASFARLGEHGRWIDARLLEGSILCDAQDGRSARDIFMQLATDTEASSNVSTAARIENNVAAAYAVLGDVGLAAKHLVAAVRLYEEVGAQTEAARARWTIGTILIQANPSDAERRLRESAAELERMGLAADAGLVELDLIEALLVQDRRAEIPALCSRLVTRFSAAGMFPAALTAAAFLRESAASGRVTVGQVQYVRTYLRRAETDHRLLFQPPPD